MAWVTARSHTYEVRDRVTETTDPSGRRLALPIHHRRSLGGRHTAERKGTEESSSPAEALPPGDIVPVAWYHTHGAYNPKYGAGNYRHSPEDKDFSDATGKSNYLGDPAKRVRRYDPDPARNRQGKVKELGKCICTK